MPGVILYMVSLNPVESEYCLVFGFASLDMYTLMLYTDEYTIEINSNVVNRDGTIKNLSLIIVQKHNKLIRLNFHYWDNCGSR